MDVTGGKGSRKDAQVNGHEPTDRTQDTAAERKDEEARKDKAQAKHQRLVLTDPAAFRYLEEDPSTTVLERRRRLQGYQLYLVEQWACSRAHPTFVITTYTGQEQHSVVVHVLSIPTDEETWSPRLRVYLEAVQKYHARRKETPLGTLMVTNLSGFPSALTVIAIPDGDLRNHRERFIVNEDLKRLGCSGRAGLGLAPPIDATQARFKDLYHTSSEVAVPGAVVELIKLSQVALTLFGKLAPEFADGLLCDVTERAISDWWADIGSDFLNVEPTDGILGPTTVSALLGLLMGARKRLNAYGAPVGKDVFDAVLTKRAIAYFQKSQKIERTRILDRKTLERLHKVTAKAASNEGWMVPRAVKSTMAELSGKGGAMVSGREEAGIADVETLDIDTFILLGSGNRFKWLWYGKPRKKDSEILGALDDPVLFGDEEQTNGGTKNRRRSMDDEWSSRRVQQKIVSSATDGVVGDPVSRRAVLRNVADKVTDAKTGFGRIRDKVSRRGHAHKISKDVNIADDSTMLEENDQKDQERKSMDAVSEVSATGSPARSRNGSPASSQNSSRRGSGEIVDAQRNNDPSVLSGPGAADASTQKLSASNRETNLKAGSENASPGSAEGKAPANDSVDGISPQQPSGPETDRSGMRKDRKGSDKSERDRWSSDSTVLRTTKSTSNLLDDVSPAVWQARLPRRMSTSAVNNILSTDITPEKVYANSVPGWQPGQACPINEQLLSIRLGRLERRIDYLKTFEAPFVDEAIGKLEAIEQRWSHAHATMDEVHTHKSNDFHENEGHLHELVHEKKVSLMDKLRDTEALNARLDYELHALQYKIEDAEDGVDEFERQLVQLENVVTDLGEGSKRESSWSRKILGFGMF